MIEDIVGVDRNVTKRRLREIEQELKELRRQPKSVDQVKRIKELYRTRGERSIFQSICVWYVTIKLYFARHVKDFT